MDLSVWKGVEQHTDIQIRALLTHTYMHTCIELLSVICITYIAVF